MKESTYFIGDEFVDYAWIIFIYEIKRLLIFEEYHARFKKINLWVLTYQNYYDYGSPVILVHYKISKMEIFGVPSSIFLWEIDICDHWVFCGKFNPEQLLFEAFFDIIRIVCSVQP